MLAARVPFFTTLACCVTAFLAVPSGSVGATLKDGRAGAFSPPSKCPATTIREAHRQFDSDERLIVGPPAIAVKAQPGETVSLCVSIASRRSKQSTILLSGLDVEPSKNGRVVFTLGEISRDARFGTGAWIALPFDEFLIDPGDDVVLPFTIRVPEDAAPGSNYLALGAKAVAARTTSDEGSVGVGAQLAVFIDVQLPGALDRKLVVDQVRGPGRLLWHDRSARVRFRARNVGPQTENVKAQLTLTPTFHVGKDLGVLRYERARVLRGGNRDFSDSFRGHPWIGRFVPELRVTSEQGTVVKQLPAVWILPPWWYLAIVFVLIAIAVWVTIRHRRRQWAQYLDDEDADAFDDEV